MTRFTRAARCLGLSHEEEQPRGRAWRSRREDLRVDSIAAQVRADIETGKLPDIKFPVRSLDNVTYGKAKGYFELGDAKKDRTLTATAKSFAQTLRLMATSRAMVEHDDFATKREVYYISKNWGDCRFDDQAESDATMDDIEAMASMHGLSREQLRFYPESHGGSVAGRLTAIDRNPATGATVEIDCANLGSGAYSLQHSVEHLSFRTDALFVLAIERHVSAPEQPLLLGGGAVHRRRDGRGADARGPTLHSRAVRCAEIAGLWFRRLRPVRLHEHLSHAEGRIRQCRSRQPLPVCAAGAIPRGHAAGYCRFRARGRDPPVVADGHQARRMQ